MSASVVHAEDLVRELGSVVLLDARTGPDSRASFVEGHLPSARFVDVDHDLAAHGDPAHGGRHPLPSPSELGATLGRLGIGPSDDVVVYDLASGSNAASRLWWMLRAIGHARVRVLDGSRASWERSGLVMVRDEARFEARAPYPITEYALATVDADAVDEARNDATYVVVDARSAPRFRGETEPFDPIAGHIPGAKNLFHLSLLDADGRFLEPAAVASTIGAVTSGRAIDKVIVHCGSGVTACHLILAMDYAGLGIPSLYVGSWSEWCRSDRPRATGPE